MTKGTPSFGRHNKTTHLVCRRCGNHSFHKTKKRCAKCGYPDSKIRKYKWQWKDTLTRGRKR